MESSFLDNLVLGSDGTYSVYNDKYAQSYHAKSLGALKESLLKHILPARHFLLFKAKLAKNLTKEDIEFFSKNIYTCDFNKYLKQCSNTYFEECFLENNVLDICFGLGYNAFLSLLYFKNSSIFSPELQKNILDDLLDFPYPPIFNRLNLKQNLRVLKTQAFRYKSSTLRFKAINAISYAEGFEDLFFDVVMQDAFSYMSNSELWSYEYFCLIYKKMKKGSVITTYAKARKILETALNAGFLVYKHKEGALFFKI